MLGGLIILEKKGLVPTRELPGLRTHHRRNSCIPETRDRTVARLKHKDPLTH